MAVIQPQAVRADNVATATETTLGTFTVPQQPDPTLIGVQSGDFAAGLDEYDFLTLNSSEIDQLFSGTDGLRIDLFQGTAQARQIRKLAAAIRVDALNNITVTGQQSSGGALDMAIFLLMQYNKGKSTGPVSGKALTYVTFTGTPAAADVFGDLTTVDLTDLKANHNYAIRKAYLHGANLEGARWEHADFDGLYWYLPSGLGVGDVVEIDYLKLFGQMPVFNTSSPLMPQAHMNVAGAVNGFAELIEL